MLGEFAGRIDAWLLAEGIETAAELAAFARLGVPLAQGWLLAPPGPGWPGLLPGVGAALRTMAARALQVHQVAPLVEAVTPVPVGDPDSARTAVRAAARTLLRADSGRDVVVAVDDRGCPVELVRAGLRDGDRAGELAVVPVSLRVGASAPLVEVVTRAMTRVAARRFRPRGLRRRDRSAGRPGPGRADGVAAGRAVQRRTDRRRRGLRVSPGSAARSPRA